MIKYKDKKILKYTTNQLFNLVVDIESYPEFIPWITRAKILQTRDNVIIAELFIKYKKINTRFTSKVKLEKPQGDNDKGSINVLLIEGPFKFLRNEWLFISVADGTELSFNIEFAFNSHILQKIMGRFFNKAAHKITNIFEKRAKEIYKDV